MHFYNLTKEKGVWNPTLPKGRKSPLPKPTKRKPCVYDDGNSELRLYMDGIPVLAVNAYCPADRRRFFNQVTQKCDAWLLGSWSYSQFDPPR